MKENKLFLISFAHMCSDISSGALPACLPFLVLAFHYSYAESAFIMFAYSFLSSLVQPAFGYLADRRPALWHLPLGILLVGCGVGSLGYLPGYAWIFAAALISGLGSALFHPVGACYARALSGEQKGTGMSIFSVGGNLGYAVGPVIAGVLLAHLGLKATAIFTVLAITASVMVYRALSVEPVPGSRKKAGDTEEKNDWNAFGWLTGVILSRSGIFYAFNAFIALYWMKYFGVSASTGAYVLALFGIAGLFSNILGGWLSDRVGSVSVLRITQAVILPGIVLFTMMTSPWLAGIILMVLSLVLYASYSPLIVLGQSYLAKNPAFSAGVTLGLSRSAGGISMPLIGIIADHFGLKGAILSLVVLSAVGLFCALRLKRSVKGS